MAARDVPDAWRVSVARHLEAWIEAHAKGLPQRRVASMLGMTQPTLNQVRRRVGPLGLHVLLQLRAGLGLSLDTLLGLPPISPLERERPADRLTAEDVAALQALTSRSRVAIEDAPIVPVAHRLARRVTDD